MLFFYYFSKSAIKLLNKRKTLPPPEVAIYQNEEFEKAIITGKVDKYKVSNFFNISTNEIALFTKNNFFVEK